MIPGGQKVWTDARTDDAKTILEDNNLDILNNLPQNKKDIIRLWTHHSRKKSFINYLGYDCRI